MIMTIHVIKSDYFLQVTVRRGRFYVYTPISCDQLSLNDIIYLINMIYKYIQGRYSYEQCNVNVLWSCYVCFEQW